MIYNIIVVSTVTSAEDSVPVTKKRKRARSPSEPKNQYIGSGKTHCMKIFN